MKSVFKFLLGAIAFLIVSVFAVTAKAQQTVTFPFGNADVSSISKSALAVSHTQSVNNLCVYLRTVPDTSYTLNLSIRQGIRAGAILYVESKSGATARNVIMGTGFSTPDTIVGQVNTNRLATYVYDGIRYRMVSVRNTGN